MARNIRRKKHKVFKTFGILMALVLIVGATVAITLALLNDTTDTKTNTFVSDNKMDLELTEPGWSDPDDPDNPSDGKHLAEYYTPGLDIPKDPTLTNLAKFEHNAPVANTDPDVIAKIKNTLEYKSKSMYVALKLEYQILKADVAKEDASVNLYDDTDNTNWEKISYDTFRQLADIKNKTTTSGTGFNTDNWQAKTGGTYDSGKIDENTVFYYKTMLGPSIKGVKDKDGNDIAGIDNESKDQTNPLFDVINIEQALSQETIFLCDGGEDGTLLHFKEDSIGDKWTVADKTWADLKAKDSVGGALAGYTFSTPAPGKTAPYQYEKNSTITYVHVGLVPFRIKVTGYAVQAYINQQEMIAPGDVASPGDIEAVDELDKLMGIAP